MPHHFDPFRLDQRFEPEPVEGRILPIGLIEEEDSEENPSAPDTNEPAESPENKGGIFVRVMSVGLMALLFIYALVLVVSAVAAIT
jgi:hypothetical protein